MRVLRRYSDEFKTDALALLDRSDQTLSEVARNLGVPHWTLRGWYRMAEMAKRKKKQPAAKTDRYVSTGPGTESDAERVARLEAELKAARKEVESLKLDREILKKAAAFFVKESE
jgi:transposase